MTRNELKQLSVQFVKYGLVGGIAFAVDYSLLWVLTEYAGLHYLLSAAISFIAGLVCNYAISTAWVFGEGKVGNKTLEFLLFALIGVGGLVLNELIVYICTAVLQLHYLLSKIVSTAIVFFWNFCARRFILYKS